MQSLVEQPPADLRTERDLEDLALIAADLATSRGHLAYHIKPAVALPVLEIRRGLGAALRAGYRGGRWFESTAAHHRRSISRTGIVESLPAHGGVDEGLPAHGLGRWMERVADFRDGPDGALNPDQPAA
jgi:hypothetical protein